MTWHSKRAMKWLLDTGLDELADGDFEGKVGRLNVSIGVHSTDLGRPHTYFARIERDVSGGNYEVAGYARTPWKAWDNCLDAARRVHDELLIGQGAVKLRRIGGGK